jgi:hypothetical protein
MPEPDSPKAPRLRADSQGAVHELLAPDVFPVEVGHALTRAERRGIIPVGTPTSTSSTSCRRPRSCTPPFPLLRRAVAISSAARIGVYDCLTWLWPSARAARW